jgi:hypothetical protein
MDQAARLLIQARSISDTIARRPSTQFELATILVV